MSRDKSFAHLKRLVLTAVVSASISVGKQAFAVIPNVEVVTLFILLFTYAFGPRIMFPAVFVFVTIECFIWGFSSWSISYYIYWPLLTVITFICRKLIDKNQVTVPVIISFIMTAFFGVLTTMVDILLRTDLSAFVKNFIALYLRGTYFYIVHIVSNSLIVFFLFKPLSRLLKQNTGRYFVNRKGVSVI